jgi:dTDP-glucose pyrophosphorylase
MNINDYLITKETSINNCLKKIDSSGYGSLVVVNHNNIFFSVVTDGDLRRLILNKINLEKPIKNFCNKKSKYLNKMSDETSVKNFLLDNGINILPVLNNKKEVIHIYFLTDLLIKNKLKKFNEAVVIMAGGKGLRMKPFTNVFPKALLPFGESTILEEIINSFEKDGYKKFFLTSGFKSINLIDYLKSKKKDKSVSFYKEKKPLGTIGGIKKLKKKLTENFFVVNCDTFLKLDYSKVLNFHLKNNNYLTIMVAMDTIQLNYGICKVKKNGQLIKIEEKPKNDILINTGSYLFNKKCLNYIPKDKFFNTTDLIKKLINQKKKIAIFPVFKNQWKDVGNWDDYRKVTNSI